MSKLNMRNSVNIIKSKLKNLKKENIIFLAIILVAILIGIILYLFTTGGDDTPPKLEPGSVDQSLPFQEGKTIEINPNDEGFVNEVNYDKLPVYELIADNHVDLVRTFLVESGNGTFRQENYSDIVYQWTANKSDDFYAVEYSVAFDRVFFRFEEGFSPSKLGNQSYSKDSLAQYFTSFAQGYFNSEFEYTDFKVSTVGRDFKIEANRSIDGVPLEVSGFQEFSDYLIVEENGEVSEGQFYLFEYDEKSGVELDLLSPLQLGSVISRDDYPREFNQRAPVGYDPSDFGYEEYPLDPGSSFAGDPPLSESLEEIPTVTSCTATGMKVVYFFTNTSTNKLAPVYKIDCHSKVMISDKEYDVPVVIYASAIDPEYVYIPGTIDLE
jgi:hypothetical protein